MKKIEFVYPEFSGLYGEPNDLEYLKKCSKEISIIETHPGDTPKFITGEADMVYIGSMTEDDIEKTIELLMPYRNYIIHAIQSGMVFVVTGNAPEIFGTKIIGDDILSDEKVEIRGLSIFDYKSVRRMTEPRCNTHFVGNFNGMLMIGCRSQNSYIYGDFNTPFIKVYKGKGMNPDTDLEGIHVKNFFGTSSIGPFMLMNPVFTKYLLRLLGLKDDLFSENDVQESFNDYLEELRAVI
ncbi:MAG: hypothetical protein IKS99_04560 [Firmicutes bacterium]|nr:hypothetical protein [Bacillota bacterium]